MGMESGREILLRKVVLLPSPNSTPPDARRDNSASSGMITSTKTELQIPQ